MSSDKNGVSSFSGSFATGAEIPVVPRVILVCPTYRKETGFHDESFRARYEGLRALYDTFVEQDYPKDKLELRIADSSETPHKFFMQLKDPRVKYLHLPDRSAEQKMRLSGVSSYAADFLLTDQELKEPHNRDKIQALQLYCSRKQDPVSFEMIPSIPDPLQNPRPSIGMKRNILCALPFTADGGNQKPDIIIAADDDDWRSSLYVKKMVNTLQDADWTKLVNYHLALYMSDSDKFAWGRKKFDLLQPQDQGSLPDIKFSNSAMLYQKGQGFNYKEPDDVFKSPRWHPLSTDGAVHALRYSAWERTVDMCGGYSPVSYNEDTLMFESLRMLGNLGTLNEVQRNPHVTKGLLGNRDFSTQEIEQDKNLGPIKFNPIADDDFDFLRLCCANVSPVALSELVEEKEIPAELKTVFSYVLKNQNTAPRHSFAQGTYRHDKI